MNLKAFSHFILFLNLTLFSFENVESAIKDEVGNRESGLQPHVNIHSCLVASFIVLITPNDRSEESTERNNHPVQRCNNIIRDIVEVWIIVLNDMVFNLELFDCFWNTRDINHALAESQEEHA